MLKVVKTKKNGGGKVYQGENKSLRKGKRKKIIRLVGAAKTSEWSTEWCRFQQKSANLPGLQKRKEWSYSLKDRSWQGRFYQKGMGQSRLSKSGHCEMGKSQCGESRTLGRKSRVRARACSINIELHAQECGL